MHHSLHVSHSALRFGIVLAWLTCALNAQNNLTLVDSPLVQIVEPTKTVACTVAGVRPFLELDLKYHTGYTASLPLKAIPQNGGAIKISLRVMPLDHPSRVAWLKGSIQAPPLGPDAKGDVELSGEYVVGPGRYRVDWLLDSGGTVCAANWKIDASDKNLADRRLGLPPETVGAVAAPFEPAIRVVPTAERELYVKVLVNYSPAGVDHSAITGADLEAITSIARAVALDPQFTRIGVVAFSIDQEQVLYRQSASSSIDFPAMGQAISNLRMGTVNIRHLQDPESGAKFLTKFLSQELSAEEPRPDAVIVVSPNIDLGRRSRYEALVQQISAACPVFYLHYNPDPQADAWPGALSNLVKNIFRGAEYTVTRPVDLSSALEKIRTSFVVRAGS